jgi:hypothetical protein
MTTRTSCTARCSTLLCLGLRSKVTGTNSVYVVRKTPVPEAGASRISPQVARKEASGTVSLASRVCTNRRNRLRLASAFDLSAIGVEDRTQLQSRVVE